LFPTHLPVVCPYRQNSFDAFFHNFFHFTTSTHIAMMLTKPQDANKWTLSLKTLHACRCLLGQDCCSPEQHNYCFSQVLIRCKLGLSVRSTSYPLHSPVSPSLPLLCVAVCHHISTGLYRYIWSVALPVTSDWKLKSSNVLMIGLNGSGRF
jgi:hypothetical protein